ncbi:MAG: hypothetical protein H6R21_1555 [Proteobacteria bacterium]|nr:hypothetical protein [Pseudomonadota bacterium]
MSSRKQLGQALFAALFLLVIGVGALVFYLADPSRLQRSSDEKTAVALAQAKEALIGWKLNDNNRPGVLPCPDVNDDGAAESLSGIECPSYLGRLPWKTLGLPELRDGSGEKLWYALSRNFRNDDSAEPVNTDTKGTITVYSQTTGTVMASAVTAVIFAPGPVQGNQDRSPANTMSCTVPAGTIFRNQCAANYLETASTTDNASATGPYITAQSTTFFNDKLLIVSAADVMIPVEKRAAREILNLLQLYRTNSGGGCNCYPWADTSNGASEASLRYGRVPLLSALPTEWSALGISIAPWLIDNQWWWVFFYTVSGDDTAAHSGGSLSLNGVSGKSVVLITTGTAGANRPAGSPGSWDTNWWSYYIDDPDNSDLGTWFITPTSTAHDRDRIYTIP